MPSVSGALRLTHMSRWLTRSRAGVPINQARVFLAETTVAQFAADTFDPVALNTSLSTDNYFYQLCLQGRYTKDSWCVLAVSPHDCLTDADDSTCRSAQSF